MSGVSFALDVSKWCDKARDNADLVVRKVALDLFSRIILRSPVDTGRFRGNWQVAIGNVPDGTIEIEDKTGQATISKATAEAANVRAGQVIYLVNNLPYAWTLETGHSKQAPAGMVGITLQEFQPIVDQVTRDIARG